MVLVSWRQMPARLVAVSKWKRHHVAGAPVLGWRSSSCAGVRVEHAPIIAD